MKSQKIILLLGGNEGNIDQNIKQAIILIQKNIGKVYCKSYTYQTDAWGPIKQQPFLNIAIGIYSIYSAHFVLQKILAIEQILGRKRQEKYGPRTIDIDILFYGNSIINHQNLIIPHPQLPNRKFVLQPCLDIIPSFVHPILKKSISTLFNECIDNLEVKKI